MNYATPTNNLANRRVIALADADNLTISFQKVYELRLDQAALHYRLAQPTQKFTAAAVLTTRPGMHFTTEAWRAGGWKVTTIIREIARTVRGAELLANADFDLCFEAGALVASHPHADTLLLCTGDGTLATAIARDVKRRRPDMSVMTAAVPGTASARLRDASLFNAFIPLGEDVTSGFTTARCA